MQDIANDDELVRRPISFSRSCRRAMPLALAERLKWPLSKAARKPIYVDCNAIAPKTAQQIGEVLQGDRRAFRRRRHHRRTAARRLQPRHLCSGKRGERRRSGCLPTASTFACIEGRHRRGVGIEDVLRRHHQGRHRDWRGDAARRVARRLRRRTAAGNVGEPAADSGAVHAADPRGSSRRPIAGSRRWRRSPHSSATIRHRATCFSASRKLYERMASAGRTGSLAQRREDDLAALRAILRAAGISGEGRTALLHPAS